MRSPRFLTIPYGSRQYEQAKRLRHDVLRVPIGLVLTEKDTEGEAKQVHFAAIDAAGNVIGTVIMKQLSPRVAKLRQMAVATAHQGKGVGKKLVAFAEQYAREHHFTEIELHARTYARGFYEKLGYIAEGEEFIDVTLLHIAMRKRLH